MASPRKIVIERINPYSLAIAKRLADRKDDVYLVEKSEKICENHKNLDGIMMIIEGEIKKDVLNKNSTNEFDVFIAASPNDGENLISCLYIKNHYKKVDIMSVVQDEESEEAFTKEGILTANSERATAKILLRYMAGNPKLTERVTATGQSELFSCEIKPGSILDNKKVSSIPLPDKDYNIVCILRDNKIMFAKPDEILKASDILQIAINPQYHKKVEQYIKK